MRGYLKCCEGYPKSTYIAKLLLWIKGAVVHINYVLGLELRNCRPHGPIPASHCDMIEVSDARILRLAHLAGGQVPPPLEVPPPVNATHSLSQVYNEEGGHDACVVGQE